MTSLFIRWQCFAAALLLCVQLSAREQHLPNERWLQIELEHYRVIFPQGHETEAQRVAAYLETYLPLMADTLEPGQAWGKFPIVLSTSSHEANGYVGLAPKRSYFYNRPAAFDGAEWFRLMTIHEGRHIQQLTKARNTPVGATSYYLLGELGPGALVALYYPDWFMEGDAVLEETLWSTGGRGRMPSFDLGLRTQELSGERGSYYKAYLGTGRDNYPLANHYDFGYLLVTYFRRTYGDDFFAEVIEQTANGLPFTFARVVQQRTGLSLEEHYQRAMDELNGIWQAQLDTVVVTEAVEALPVSSQGGWLGYFPLGTVNNGQLLSLKVGVRHAPQLVSIEGDQERSIRAMPADLVAPYVFTGREQSISVGDQRLCWVRDQQNPRFALASYGNIHCLDSLSGQVQKLSQHSKYLSVAVSPDDSTLAAMSFSTDRQVSLHLLDHQGEPLMQWPQPYSSYPFDLGFDETGQRLVFSRLTDQGFSMHEFDLSTGEERTLIATTTEETLRGPVYAGNWIAYSSDYSGIDQIWLLDRTSGERYLAIQRPHGAYFPVFDAAQNRLIFSDYTVEGDRLMAYQLPDQGLNSGWQPQVAVVPYRTDYFAPLLTYDMRFAAELTDEELSGEQYQVTNYSRAANLVQPYHWLVFPTTEGVSGYIDFNNVLNTFSANLAAEYNFDAEAAGGALNIEYRRYFPVLGASLSSRGFQQRDTNDELLTFRQNTYLASVSVPLAWRSAVRQHDLILLSGLGWLEQSTSESSVALEPSDTFAGAVGALGFNYGQRQMGAFWDEGIRRGWQTQAQWLGSLPAASDFDWGMVTSESTFGLPGLAVNHASRLSLEMEYQYGSDEDFYMASVLPGARGYSESLTKETGGTLRLDYRMPLVSLDQPITRALYLKRLAMGFSADRELAITDGEDRQRSSLGVSLFMPVNLFSNIKIQAEPVLNAYYLPESDQFNASIGFRVMGF